MKKCENCTHRVKIKENPNIYICTYKKNMKDNKCIHYQSKEEDE